MVINVTIIVCIKNHLIKIFIHYFDWKFSVPQIEYPLRGSSKKGSHVYFLLHFLGNTIVLSNCTIVWYKCSDVMMIWCHNSTIWHHNSRTMATINRKYAWLPFLLLPPSGYSIWGTENFHLLCDCMHTWWESCKSFFSMSVFCVSCLRSESSLVFSTSNRCIIPSNSDWK